MADERRCPDDPLEFIRRCVRGRQIHWTYHINMRLRSRAIPREAILDSTDRFEVIESYPEDKFLPSYLVYSHHQGLVFHALFAADVEGDNVRLVTAYRPDPKEWVAGLKKRREPR